MAASRPRAPMLLLGGAVACALRGSVVQQAVGNQSPGSPTFTAPLAVPLAGARVHPAAVAQLQGAGISAARPVAAEGGASFAAAAVAFALAAAAATAAVRSRTTCYGISGPRGLIFKKKWWEDEETRPALDIPLWQRDLGYGWGFLRLTLFEALKKGEHVYWDVRAVRQTDRGTVVEMLNSGLWGFIPKVHEGPDRLEVGKDYKVLCIKCPMKRVDKEPLGSPFRNVRDKTLGRSMPIFSHWMYLQSQANIKKANELQAGTIIEGVVRQQVTKGLLITVGGEDEGNPCGLLDWMDFSRLHGSKHHGLKLFPYGTKIKVYVVHADKENGRITLSTKEFEDDDHVGWMCHFPHYCFRNAEKGVERYHRKRDAYIRRLQR